MGYIDTVCVTPEGLAFEQFWSEKIDHFSLKIGCAFHSGLVLDILFTLVLTILLTFFSASTLANI